MSELAFSIRKIASANAEVLTNNTSTVLGPWTLNAHEKLLPLAIRLQDVSQGHGIGYGNDNDDIHVEHVVDAAGVVTVVVTNNSNDDLTFDWTLLGVNT